MFNFFRAFKLASGVSELVGGVIETIHGHRNDITALEDRVTRIENAIAPKCEVCGHIKEER